MYWKNKVSFLVGTKKYLGINFIRNAYTLYREHCKTPVDMEGNLNNSNIFLKWKNKNLKRPFLSELLM